MQRKGTPKIEKIKIERFAVCLHQSRTSGFCRLSSVLALGRPQNEQEPHFICDNKWSHVSKICQKAAFHYGNQSCLVLERKSGAFQMTFWPLASGKNPKVRFACREEHWTYRVCISWDAPCIRPQQVPCAHCGILSPRASTTRVTVQAAALSQVGHLHTQHLDEGAEVAAATGVEPRAIHVIS